MTNTLTEPTTILRTPGSAFVELSDYPFEPHYMDVAGCVFISLMKEMKKQYFFFTVNPPGATSTAI